MKLDSSHVQYVMDCMKDNTTYVRNIKKYLLAALYNAQTTINSYYSSLVQHDQVNDFVKLLTVDMAVLHQIAVLDVIQNHFTITFPGAARYVRGRAKGARLNAGGSNAGRRDAHC